MPNTFISDDELDHEVLYVINMHRGQQNAISRWEMVEKVFGRDAALVRSDGNTQDRQLRRSIERLRKQGHIISNLGEGSGYFLATTPEEYQAFRSAYGAHAFPIMETIKEMDKAAREQWPNPLQPRML